MLFPSWFTGSLLACFLASVLMLSYACVQVTAGSMWEQDDDGADDADAKPIEKYLVKWGGMSYLHVSWETAIDLIELTTKQVKAKVCV